MVIKNKMMQLVNESSQISGKDLEFLIKNNLQSLEKLPEYEDCRANYDPLNHQTDIKKRNILETLKNIFNKEEVLSQSEVEKVGKGAAYLLGVIQGSLDKGRVDEAIRLTNAFGINNIKYIRDLIMPVLTDRSKTSLYRDYVFLSWIYSHREEIERLEKRNFQKVGGIHLMSPLIEFIGSYEKLFEVFKDSIYNLTLKHLTHEDCTREYEKIKSKELERRLDTKNKKIELMQNTKESFFNFLKKDYENSFNQRKKSKSLQNITIDAKKLYLPYMDNLNNIYNKKELWSTEKEMDGFEKGIKEVWRHLGGHYDQLISVGCANGEKLKLLLDILKKNDYSIGSVHGYDISKRELSTLIDKQFKKINYDMLVGVEDIFDSDVFVKQDPDLGTIIDFTGLTSGNFSKKDLLGLMKKIANRTDERGFAMVDYGIMKDRDKEIQRYKSERNIEFISGVAESLGFSKYKVFVEYENENSNTILQGIEMTDKEKFGKYEFKEGDRIILISSKKFTTKEIKELEKEVKLAPVHRVSANSTMLVFYIGEKNISYDRFIGK